MALFFSGAAAESQVGARFRELAGMNKVFRSYLGQGFHNTLVPSVIKRCLLENPGWYTQYTPYQAGACPGPLCAASSRSPGACPEMSQGRLQSLLTFQTLVSDLTGLPTANSSLLDDGTAAAEAMFLAYNSAKQRHTFLVDAATHPHVIAVIRGRAEPIGIKVVVAPVADFKFSADTFGCLVSYPSTTGEVADVAGVAAACKAAGGHPICLTDLLALTMLTPPGELGFDIAVGNSQRFGVPLGYGGPHAAFIACIDDRSFMRLLPGRIVGVTKDSNDQFALRLALQTREQHIRREKATSNICTAQALLANMVSSYAVFHGPHGLKNIAERVHTMTSALAQALRDGGHSVPAGLFFDTIKVVPSGCVTAAQVHARANAKGINLRPLDDGRAIGISLDETTTYEDLVDIVSCFSAGGAVPTTGVNHIASSKFARASSYLTHEVFNKFHSETEMMRYLKYLENKDVSLCHTMIPLGSCTMKLNSATEMQALTWPEFANIHPFVPKEQAAGYLQMFKELEHGLLQVSGYDAISLQPNSGAQGEFAGLLCIRNYHIARGEGHRTKCIIPSSAHGTNPASAMLAGFEVINIPVKNGALDLADLEAVCKQHAGSVGAFMLTYPSTCGIFEETAKEACAIVHRYGGQVYLDGANMNAQTMLCRPADIGADVSHFNLHKTFCIPHGGGGPGMGPIGVKSQLAPFLPGHPQMGASTLPPVSSAPFGSSLIATISWSYIQMMGSAGLAQATSLALLNANYMASRLAPHYPIMYRGSQGFVAHEFILDMRPFLEIEKHTDGKKVKWEGITCTDIAKRLQDFGFHSPTMSWPEPNSLMVEPTESESKAELDRYVDALIQIRKEIQEVQDGKISVKDSVLRNAPHTQPIVMADKWDRKYSREQAAFPLPYLRRNKFWPTVGRVNDVYGAPCCFAR